MPKPEANDSIIRQHTRVKKTAVTEKAKEKKNTWRTFLSLDALIILVTAAISVIALAWYFSHGMGNLADPDSIPRLNLARKLFDSLQPGIGQLGDVWLPLPTILMAPFAINSYLWHSGIAGAIVSMLAFIAGAYYTYKTILLITQNKVAAAVGWLAFVSNIDLLWFQASPMSESFFLFGIVMVIYFLTSWINGKTLTPLVYAAFFCVIVTLTRYEGYAVFGGAFLCVLLASRYFKTRYSNASDHRKVEGISITFFTLACLGIILWCLYSAAIFGDPLHWLHIYSGSSVAAPTTASGVAAQSASTSITNASRASSLLHAAKTYTWAMALMLGLPFFILGVVATVPVVIRSLVRLVKKQSDPTMPVSIIIVCLYPFLIFGYMHGLIPTIFEPTMSMATLRNVNSNLDNSTNIRYGLVMFPVLIFAVGIWAGKSRVKTAVFLLVVLLQLTILASNKYFIMENLGSSSKYSVPSYVAWFKQNYNGGLILTSANQNEYFMFQTGLPYRTFIYEGVQRLWFVSLADPEKHAEWVMFQNGVKGDEVSEFINRKQLKTAYNLAYHNGDVMIYHLKPGYRVDNT